MESKYYVWCPTRDMPTRAHPGVEEARIESRRLAEQNPEVEFIILRAVESVTCTQNPYRVVNYCF